MTRAREQQISLDDTHFYHCMARCVRRAFLCGEDALTGRSYEHRKAWVVDRLRELAGVFAIDVCAYAILGNHYHAVLRADPDRAEGWDLDEVVRRWRLLFSGGALVERYVQGDATQAERDKVGELVEQWRARLSDISWFMRCLNESIARQANQEDGCKGRFWEGRFKSQALLDEGALLACMAYVDLNPVRAGITDTPETSDFTSIQERIRRFAQDSRRRGRPPQTTMDSKTPEPAGNTSARQPESTEARGPTLFPFVGNERQDRPEGIAFAFHDYLELVDWTGRAIREDKRGHIPSHLAPILERLGYSPDQWLVAAGGFRRRFGPFAGASERLRSLARKLGRKWLRGVGLGCVGLKPA